MPVNKCFPYWGIVGVMDTAEPLHLDVRPLLDKGIEPFPAIMEAKTRLVAGQSFVLTAPFDPKPLYGLFEAEGFSVEAKQLSGGAWEIHFTPEAGANGQSVRELDVRFLEPPGPLQKSLEALAALGRNQKLVLHTRFRPVHLFEQIDPDAVDYDCEEVGENHWITHLWRLTA